MAATYGVLCSDFYVNQKLSLKLDVPTAREAVLDMFDRVRKDHPTMDRFRRYESELALESPELESQYSWVALRRTSLRSGWVNPESVEQAYKLHRLVLDVAPYYLSVSPLDVDYLELVYGFDLEAKANRDEIVFDALFADSPLASLIDIGNESLIDVQPFLGFSLNESCDLQAFVEIKTRTRASEVATGRFEDTPISVYLTVRRYGSLKTISDITTSFGALAGHIERLADQRVIPAIVMPIRQAILSNPG